MTDFITGLAPVATICPMPLPLPDRGKGCEALLNIGVFFDGTDNNKPLERFISGAKE